MNVVLVFLGGGLGSVCRYSIGIFIQKTSLSLPLATLLSNVLACIIFAYTLTQFQAKNPGTQGINALVLTGFCGGLSTFSTFGYESFLLLRQGNYSWLIINIVMSLILCLGSFILIKKNGF